MKEYHIYFSVKDDDGTLWTNQFGFNDKRDYDLESKAVQNDLIRLAKAYASLNNLRYEGVITLEKIEHIEL